MTLTEENALLREALEAVEFKLRLYRSAHNGSYIGGMEFGALIKLIARAVLKQPAVPNGERQTLQGEST